MVRRNLDVGEAARDALGKTFAEPVTDVAVMGFRRLEGGGGDAATAEIVDQFCGVAKMVVDPAGFVSSVVDRAVRHCITQALAASLGPIGIGIAFFAGKFAGELTRQALDAGEDSAGMHGATYAIELTDMAADTSLGRLAESDQFREYVSDLLGEKIIAIFPSETRAAHGQAPDHAPGQPATIRVTLVAYKVDSPTGTHPADQQKQLRLQQRLDKANNELKEAKTEAARASREGDLKAAGKLKHEDIPALERELAEANHAVASSGDSRTIRVQATPFALACVPEETVAARQTWTSYEPDRLGQESLLLTDGTLIERHIRGEARGPWTRGSNWCVTTDPQEAKELLERRGHELTSQLKGVSKPTSVLDADLLIAYHALKEWATRNGIQ